MYVLLFPKRIISYNLSFKIFNFLMNLLQTEDEDRNRTQGSADNEPIAI